MAGEKSILDEMWSASGNDVTIIKTNGDSTELRASAMAQESTGTEAKGVEDPQYEGNNYSGSDLVDQDKFFEGKDINKEKQVGDTTEPKNEANKDSPAPNDTKGSSPIPYSLVFDALVEQDSLSAFDKDEFDKIASEQGEAQAIASVFQKEAEYAREEARKEVEGDKQLWMKLMDKGLTPQEAFDATTLKSKFSSISGEDLSGEENESRAIEVAKTYYMSVKGFSKDEADEQIEGDKALGKLEARAKKFLPEITKFADESINKSIQTKKAEQQAQADSNRKLVEAYKTAVQAIDEYIPGQKVNKQTKDKIEDSILSGAIYKKIDEDRIKYIPRIAYLDSIGFFDGKTDKIIAGGKSKAMDELNNVLKKVNTSDVKANMNYNQEDGDNSDFDKFLSKSKNKR